MSARRTPRSCTSTSQPVSRLLDSDERRMTEWPAGGCALSATTELRGGRASTTAGRIRSHSQSASIQSRHGGDFRPTIRAPIPGHSYESSGRGCSQSTRSFDGVGQSSPRASSPENPPAHRADSDCSLLPRRVPGSRRPRLSGLCGRVMAGIPRQPTSRACGLGTSFSGLPGRRRHGSRTGFVGHARMARRSGGNEAPARPGAPHRRDAH